MHWDVVPGSKPSSAGEAPQASWLAPISCASPSRTPPPPGSTASGRCADARTFHPKAFMTLSPTANWVLSRSENLRLGGRGAKRREFELLRLHAGPVKPGHRAPDRFESVANIDLTKRWAPRLRNAIATAWLWATTAAR